MAAAFATLTRLANNPFFLGFTLWGLIESVVVRFHTELIQVIYRVRADLLAEFKIEHDAALGIDLFVILSLLALALFVLCWNIRSLFTAAMVGGSVASALVLSHALLTASLQHQSELGKAQ